MHFHSFWNCLESNRYIIILRQNFVFLPLCDVNSRPTVRHRPLSSVEVLRSSAKEQHQFDEKIFSHLEILFYFFAEKYKQKHTLLVQKWAWTNQKDPWISPPPPTRDPLQQWKMEKRSLKKSLLMRRSSLMTPQRYGIS